MKAPKLDAAFRATTYRVKAGEAVFDLRIDEANPPFATWLRQQSASLWGIITACNPGGKPTLQQNAVRTGILQKRIEARGWRHFPALNFADARDWPDEPGFCVLDAEVNVVRALAVEFGQVAIVCGSAEDGRGEIVWLDDAQG